MQPFEKFLAQPLIIFEQRCHRPSHGTRHNHRNDRGTDEGSQSSTSFADRKNGLVA
jgi:hypothetical protein